MSDKHLRQGETRIVALPQSVENSPTTLFHPAKDPSIAQLQLYVSPLFPTLAIADIVIIQSPEPGLYFALATDKLPDLCLMTSVSSLLRPVHAELTSCRNFLIE
jgi:hypothetical protein